MNAFDGLNKFVDMGVQGEGPNDRGSLSFACVKRSSSVDPDISRHCRGLSLLAGNKISMIRLSNLVGLMAASAEGCSYRPEFPWPLHKALVSVRVEADRQGFGNHLPNDLVVAGLPEAGRGVPGLGDVILELLGSGDLSPAPYDDRLLVVNEVAVPQLRRLGLGVDHPQLANAIYRAALLWATESSICEKNWATARASWRATVLSDTPKPLQAVVGDL